MQVGESRAASLGHTSGISWVEGDAQVKPEVIISLVLMLGVVILNMYVYTLL